MLLLLRIAKILFDRFERLLNALRQRFNAQVGEIVEYFHAVVVKFLHQIRCVLIIFEICKPTNAADKNHLLRTFCYLNTKYQCKQLHKRWRSCSGSTTTG